jgi:hypothetical protein
MAQVGRPIGLCIITRNHLFGGFGTVKRTRAKKRMGTISRPVREV